MGNGSNNELNSQFAIVLLFLILYESNTANNTCFIIDCWWAYGKWKHTKWYMFRRFRITTAFNSIPFNSIQWFSYVYSLFRIQYILSESPHPIFLLSIPSNWSESNIIILKRKYAFAVSRWRNFVHLLSKCYMHINTNKQQPATLQQITMESK